MAGIENSLDLINQTKALVLDVAVIAKAGISFGSLSHLFSVLGELKKIGDDAKNVLPEVADLDAGEAAQLLSASYAALQAVIAALKS